MIDTPVGLALAFEARGEVHRIAHRGVGEALVRTHVADDALAGIEADRRYAIGVKRASLRRGFGRKLAVDAIEFGKHGKRALAGMIGMAGIVERRVPERHDAIADVFVDRAAPRQDLAGHRREETAIDQPAEALRGCSCTPRRWR